MPDVILPTGEYALVAHPTNWTSYPYILLGDRWGQIRYHQSLRFDGVSEADIQDAIANRGYRPVFFGLRLERPDPTGEPYPTIDITGLSASFNTISESTQQAEDGYQRLAQYLNRSVPRPRVDGTYERQQEMYDAYRSGQRAGRIPGGVYARGGVVGPDAWDPAPIEPDSEPVPQSGNTWADRFTWRNPNAPTARQGTQYYLNTGANSAIARGTRAHLAIADEIQHVQGYAMEDTNRTYPTTEQATRTRRR